VAIASSTTLHRQSLGGQIAAQLRQDILLGRIAPGTPVSQQRLCEDFGTSRMPARDALRALTHEGLVETTATGHTVVAQLTPEDIADAFLVEALVHGRAARRAAANATADHLGELRSVQAQMVDAATAGDIARAGDLNWRFHARINALARSARLLGLIRTASLSIPRDYLFAMPTWVERSNREHAQIVDALEARDADRAERAAREHVEAAGTNLVAHLREKGLLQGSS
jgi:DNA-binding GntR family transcriptional regulator